MKPGQDLEFPYTAAEIQHIAERRTGFIPICQYLAPIARIKDSKTGLDVLFNCYLAYVAGYITAINNQRKTKKSRLHLPADGTQER